MPDLIRRRTIRPSTRKDSSVNYRVDITGLASSDTLIVEISHESKPFQKSYKFRGKDVLQRKSLGFKVTEEGNRISINWVSTQPIS